MATGVDTLRCGGAVSGVDQDSEGWLFSGAVGPGGKWSITKRYRELVDGVYLSVIPGRESVTAWVEGSAPKYLQDGVNYPAVPVSVIPDVGLDWIGRARDFVTWEESPRINRLDVVADLDVGVDRVTDVLSTVGGFVSGGRATRAIYRDPTANRAMTVWARTKRSGGGRLYDKRAESGVEAAAGIVRFEGQERTNSLQREGVRKLELVTAENVERLLRDRWLWCGFGSPVVPRDQLVREIMNREGWRWDTKLKMVGWITSGFSAIPNRSTEWRYRQRLLSIGQLSDTGHWRLDLDEGIIDLAA